MTEPIHTVLVTIDKSGRALKTWRALYRVLASMKLCIPTMNRRKPSEGRCGRAYADMARGRGRLDGQRGAAGWLRWTGLHHRRGMGHPVLSGGFENTPAQAVTSGHDMAFAIERTKTTEAAAFGILSKRTQRLVEWYLASLFFCAA